MEVLTHNVKGLIEVEVIHCTYLIRHEVLDSILYNDGSGRYEYVIFSDTLRKKGIPQYIDNRRCYGKITFCNIEEDFNTTDILAWAKSYLTKEGEFQQGKEAAPAGEIFSQIYDENLWGNGSGWGSLEIYTRSYREFLQKFFAEKSITSVVDIGCGDWQIARHINWDGISYLGIDVVESVINENKKHFSNTNIEFQCLDVMQEESLPKADLIIIKDVLQHWPNEEILRFLPKLSSYKYALITNCALGNNINGDITLGDFRPLDLCAPPFHCNYTRVFSFPSDAEQRNWKKVVYLFQAPLSMV